jgi:acetate kinase
VRVLTVNAGSASLKLSIVEEGDRVRWQSELPALEGARLRGALSSALAEAGALDAIGHRVVHGGARFQSPVVLTPAMRAVLAGTADFAPLYNPPALAAIAALAGLRPGVPEVACFDTAFHRSLPPAAASYALPAAWADRWPLRRFGFHGLSHAWVARRAPQLLEHEARRIVSCHLGAGASLAAILDGESVDTTAGFTPLDGLIGATRAGAVDPGLLLWVQRHGSVSPQEAERALDRHAGLLGLSRRSGDIRDVIAGADAGDARCRLALDSYLHRLRAGIAAMAAALGGLDALVFTGGVGESSPRIRADAASQLRFLGIDVDARANEEATADAVLSSSSARADTLVVRAREDLQIAHEVRVLLGEPA